MGLPSYVSAGTYVTTASATTLTGGLPASRTNNNVLVAYVSVKATGLTFTHSAGGTGWTIVATQNANGQSGAFAWRLVDGSEAAPTWSWTGAAAGATQILQFTGNDAVTPIGNYAYASADASTTITLGTFVTTSNNSLLYAPVQTSNSQTIPPPTWNWTSLGAAANANTSAINLTAAAYNSGGTTPADTMTVTSSNWLALVVEIKGSGAALYPDQIRASHADKQILGGLASADTGLRASHVVKQILTAYSGPTNLGTDETKVVASHVVLQILRSDNAGVDAPFLDDGDSFYGPVVTTVDVFDSIYPPPPTARQGWNESDIFFTHRVRVRHLGQDEDGSRRMVMRKGVRHFVKGDSK